MCVRVHVLMCVCMHMCVQTCMPGLVCLFAHLYAGENMCVRIRVHTHVRAAGSAIQDTYGSGDEAYAHVRPGFEDHPHSGFMCM